MFQTDMYFIFRAKKPIKVKIVCVNLNLAYLTKLPRFAGPIRIRYGFAVVEIHGDRIRQWSINDVDQTSLDPLFFLLGIKTSMVIIIAP